jgi:hypothetical protein
MSSAWTEFVSVKKSTATHIIHIGVILLPDRTPYRAIDLNGRGRETDLFIKGE